jgi:hypothetical protein
VRIVGGGRLSYKRGNTAKRKFVAATPSAPSDAANGRQAGGAPEERSMSLESVAKWPQARDGASNHLDFSTGFPTSR